MTRRGFVARVGAGALLSRVDAGSVAADPIMALTADEWQASAARDSLLSFTRRMFPRYQAAPHHRVIADALEAVERGDVDRLIITVPPRHGKSELASAHFPAWFLGRNPDKRVIACSHTAQLAYTFSRRARNKIADAAWPFPHVHIADDKGAVQAWDIAGHMGGYVAAGVGGPIVGSGAHVLLIDDPVKSAADAESVTQRDAAWEWFTGTAYHRLEENGAIVLIMTRWHEDDLAGRLLAEQRTGGDAWTVVDLPAIAIEPDALGRQPGDPLWPAKYDAAALARIERNVGSRVWQALFQGRPTPTEGGILKRHWFRFWQHPGMGLPPVEVDGAASPVIDLPGFFDDTLQSWDLTFRETKSGSYVVGLTGGVLGAQCFILDRYRERTDFPGTINAMQTTRQRFPATSLTLVENRANGPAILDTLRPHIPGLVAVEPDGSKEARMHAAAPFVEGGGVVLPHPRIAPWVGEFLDEVTTFPLAAHDDQADALSQLVRRVASRRQSGMTDALASWYSELE